MIETKDLIRLPFTSNLTEGGLAYALFALPNLLVSRKGSPYGRLRQMVASAATELAFRRHLSKNDIPYDVKSGAPFTTAESYEVSLGGRRCELISYLISRPDQISEVQGEPAVILNAPALVPSDWHAREGHTDQDLYLFTFATGRLVYLQKDVRRLVENGEPHYIVHVMDDEWRRPLNWNPLGKLSLKSESDRELTLEILGQDEFRETITRTIRLPPRRRVLVEGPFFSITCMHADRIPEARVGIQAEMGRELYLITPPGWGNIWVYGIEIILAGFITRGEFRLLADVLAPNSRVFQFDRTRMKNLTLPIARLRPLSGLFNAFGHGGSEWVDRQED